MSAVLAAPLSPTLERLRALFESRRHMNGEIEALQRQALERFLTLGLPTSRDESWKYTNLRRLESRAFVLPESIAATESAWSAPLLSAEGWHHTALTNGHVSAIPAILPPGVRIRSLQTLMREEPETVTQLLDLPEPAVSARFEMLNRAFVGDGLLIDIAPGTVLDAPLYIALQSNAADRPWLINPYIVIRVGDGARCTVIEQHVSSMTASHFANPVTRVSLGTAAVVEHYRLQQEATQVIHLGHLAADIGRDANFVSHTLATGSALGRLDLAARLVQKGASVELNGVFLASSTQHLDTHTCIEHVCPFTRSREDYRGIADGRGRGVFNGKVIVHPDAQQTDARQSSRNLLLSSTAEIDTRPELEIYADDVKCSHGATTGQLDPAALFYLRSRAISAADARALLALAFVEAVMERMTVQPVHEHLRRFFRGYFLAAGELS